MNLLHSRTYCVRKPKPDKMSQKLGARKGKCAAQELPRRSCRATPVWAGKGGEALAVGTAVTSRTKHTRGPGPHFHVTMRRLPDSTRFQAVQYPGMTNCRVSPGRAWGGRRHISSYAAAILLSVCVFLEHIRTMELFCLKNTLWGKVSIRHRMRMEMFDEESCGEVDF